MTMLPNKPTRLTISMLRRMRACVPWIMIFKARYPSGVTITERIVNNAYSLGYPVWWLIEQVVPVRARAGMRSAAVRDETLEFNEEINHIELTRRARARVTRALNKWLPVWKRNHAK